LLFNLAFTSLPVILMGVLDQDLDAKTAMRHPQLYRRGIMRLDWTQRKFWWYMFDGLYQSVICFFLPYLLFYRGGFVSESGHQMNAIYDMGAFVFHPIIFCVNFFVTMNEYRWDWLYMLIMTLSTLLIYFWTGVYSQFVSAQLFYGLAAIVYSAVDFWATTLLTVVAALLPRVVFKVYKTFYHPIDVDIVRELVYTGLDVSDKRSEKSAASSSSLEAVKPVIANVTEDERPIYPPSHYTNQTGDNRQSGSDGTQTWRSQSQMSDDPQQRYSLELGSRPARSSYDRARNSFTPGRSSVEHLSEFTTKAGLLRTESKTSEARSSLERSRSRGV